MSETEDEKKLKRCLQLIADIISVKSLSFGKPATENQILIDTQKTIKDLLDEHLSSLCLPCRNYLLEILNKYDYDVQIKDFSNPFTKELLRLLLNDLQGAQALLDACQAAWDGNESIVKEFVEKYPTLTNKSGIYGTTLLYSAARNNHFNVVKYLIQSGKCSVNERNIDYIEKSKKSSIKATVGSTALHAACFQGHLQVVKYLIQHGADYFISNAVNETPIENAQKKANIRKFFTDLLIPTYTKDRNRFPKTNILEEIESIKETIIDCIWEYKPLTDNRWFTFSSDVSSRLQQSLSIDFDTKLINEFDLKTFRDPQKVYIAQFLLKRKNDQLDNAAWIRCRGSSLLNFRCYGQWQSMFIKHPKGVAKASPTIDILDMKSTKIQLNSWYNVNSKINFLFERAVNYRRRYISINLDFMNNELIIVDLENFIFNNQQNTIEGFLRWIPKFVSYNTKLPVTHTSQLPIGCDLTLLTRSYVKQVAEKGAISEDEIDQYNLKYDDGLSDDILYLTNQSSAKENDSTKSINLVQGNLLEEKMDVIVISTSSKYLYEGVLDAGGRSFTKSFNMTHKQNPKETIISIPAEGTLQCKAVYFTDWHPNNNTKLLCRSIQELVSNVIETASRENYTSIAFPAIGCGEYGCPVSIVAATLINQVKEEIIKHPMMLSFVIHRDRSDVYDAFEQCINPVEQIAESSTTKSVFIKIGDAKLEVIKGDITQQQANVIIGSSSSENLRQALIGAGGPEVETAYVEAYKANPNAIIISTPGGKLKCQKLFFLKWEPNKDSTILRQSVVDLIWNVVQHAMSHNFSLIAFPAIGCGEHGCAVDIIVKTMVREMKKQIHTRKLNWRVRFVVQPNLSNVYDEFCKQILSLDQEPVNFEIPSTWETSAGIERRYLLSKSKPEYKQIAKDFEESIEKQYREIVKIERIQNERWFMQFSAHAREFYKRLNENTEKHLYHGCPESAAISIMEDCFNRSFAGVNGTAYGVGVYFSSSAAYSHGYTRPNSKGERCMFVARVLIGKTTLGSRSMKTRPLGFDSTTDENHIYVTYHDAQAYADYLITYK